MVERPSEKPGAILTRVPVQTLLRCPCSPRIQSPCAAPVYSPRVQPRVQPPCAAPVYSPRVQPPCVAPVYTPRVQPPCAAPVCSPRVQPPCAVTSINICVHVNNPQIPNTHSHISLSGHTETPHTLIRMGSAALAAAVPYRGYATRISRNGQSGT